MKVYTTENIRNIVLLGHAGSGKTTALKQLALLISEENSRNVYFI